MTKTYAIYQVDAFTTKPFSGNPAGVVSDATGLTDAEMLKIAREMNCSETAFIFPKPGNGYDMEVRFFTPTMEVPVCGHATIATQYIFAQDQQSPSRSIKQKTKAGILQIDVHKLKNDYEIIMTQNPPEFGEILSEEATEDLCQALQIQKSDLDRNGPAQVVSTGHEKLLVAVKNREILNSLIPNPKLLTKLSQTYGYYGLCVFTLESQNSEILTHTRMFAPELGLLEDPVTGMAQGPLGAYLIQHRLVTPKTNPFTFLSQQGEAMDRTGHVKISVHYNDNKPTQVSISGRATIVLKGTLNL